MLTRDAELAQMVGSTGETLICGPTPVRGVSRAEMLSAERPCAHHASPAQSPGITHSRVVAIHLDHGRAVNSRPPCSDESQQSRWQSSRSTSVFSRLMLLERGVGGIDDQVCSAIAEVHNHHHDHSVFNVTCQDAPRLLCMLASGQSFLVGAYCGA